MFAANEKTIATAFHANATYIKTPAKSNQKSELDILQEELHFRISNWDDMKLVEQKLISPPAEKKEYIDKLVSIARPDYVLFTIC